MCGRFTLRTPAAELVKIFELVRTLELAPRYNIGPTQPIAAVRESPTGRELVLMHWGLIPSWAEDPRIGSRMINARSETAATKPSFRAAFARRRCLIPADGFYEWKPVAGRSKQPFYITRRDERPFAFAGLWERWKRGESPPVESCTILTTAANALLGELHDRMPVIVSEPQFAHWLDPTIDNPKEFDAILASRPSDELKSYPVSTRVNNVRNDAAECIRPLDGPHTLFSG